MRNKLFITGLMAAALLPAAAMAQPYSGCVQDNRNNNVAGAVAGAIGGAIIGGAIAGPHDRGAGVVIGGATGGFAGNAIARAGDHPCPAGYYYPQPQGGQYDQGRQYDHGGQGGPGFWDGAPSGLHARMDFMQDRINRAASDDWVSRREIRRANRELAFIRSEDQRLRYQSGGHLRPQDRDYLQARLDSLSERLNWAQHSG